MKPNLKNPYDNSIFTIEELREIAFYWIQKAHTLKIKVEALTEIMLEKGINPSLAQIIAKMNEITAKEKLDQ